MTGQNIILIIIIIMNNEITVMKMMVVLMIGSNRKMTVFPLVGDESFAMMSKL